MKLGSIIQEFNYGPLPSNGLPGRVALKRLASFPRHELPSTARTGPQAFFPHWHSCSCRARDHVDAKACEHFAA